MALVAEEGKQSRVGLKGVLAASLVALSFVPAGAVGGLHNLLYGRFPLPVAAGISSAMFLITWWLFMQSDGLYTKLRKKKRGVVFWCSAAVGSLVGALIVSYGPYVAGLRSTSG